MKDLHFIAGVSAVVGAVAGFAGGIYYADRKLRAEYETASESMRRAYELAASIEPTAPVESEDELVPDPEPSDPKVENPSLQTGLFDPSFAHAPAEKNPYHTAVTAKETSSELFVSGGVNDYGISYLEEEEYLDEEDGFEKYQVAFVMNNTEPKFFLDGAEMDDWDVRLGDSIVVDFLRFSQIAPLGTPSILYVRNHLREEDYEVVLEQP